MTYSCLLCGVSSERQPLVVHANLDCTEWLFLCYNCEKKVLAKTDGIIPINLPELLGKVKGGDEVEEWEEAECGGYITQKQLSICGSVSLLSEL